MLQALSPENSPFDAQQLAGLQASFNALNVAQSQWLSGYLAGLHAASDVPQRAVTTQAALTILFGSETGNGESVARDLAERLQAEGHDVSLASLDGFRSASLKKLRRVVFVISTHGEGDPPEEARDLFDALNVEHAPRLEQLSYRILALGDRSYTHFCEAGIRLDQRLQSLGATPFGPRIDCDVDFSGDAAAWSDDVADWVAKQSPPPSTAPARLSLVPAAPRWTRNDPFEARVLDHHPLTDQGSTRDVHHLSLSLEGAGMAYRPGDALGVWAPNDPALVQHLLELTGLDGAQAVNLDDASLPLVDALTWHRELTRLAEETVLHWAALPGADALGAFFSPLAAVERRTFIEQRQLLDLAEAWPARPEAQALVGALRPLAPRSYSIASSAALVDDEVHLSVATLASDVGLGQRWGVASGFLNRRLAAGDGVRVFLEPNRRFHLPEDDQAPLILIGAGTGIAPFRAFAQELEARGAAPDTWLMFGNPHQRTDFLYQREWLRWRDSGLVNRIDAAWSRDQAHKRYVQHVVGEQAQELAEWLNRGAHLYLCGALAMGDAVHEALVNALASASGESPSMAGQRLVELRRAGRYHRDLY